MHWTRVVVVRIFLRKDARCFQIVGIIDVDMSNAQTMP